MARAVVLGGTGEVGRFAARTLAAYGSFDQVVVADLDPDRAREAVVSMGLPALSSAGVDANQPQTVAEVVRGADVAVNCIGPFYRYGLSVLRAVLGEGVPYLDVCDDVDATRELLELDGEVRSAGAVAVIGMGNSPGVTNLLARFTAEQLLDETEAIDIFHAHGGEPVEGPGVVAHRLHGMTMEIPMYLDGALQTVRFFEDSGRALRTRVDFHLLGDGIPVYPYPHPEQLTLPRYVSCRQVTNRGTVLPDAYFQLTTEVARLGLTDTTPLRVGADRVVPRDFAVAWLLRERERLLRETGFGGPRGCTQVSVRGTRRGEPVEYVISLASTDQALGEGTGIPAALGAILLQQGKVSGPGVLPPEAAFEPADFLALVGPVLETTGQRGTFEGVRVVRVDAEGNREGMALPV